VAKSRATFDMSEWANGLDRLRTTGKESLARRMLVSGGQVLRDEAKARASVSHARTQFRYNPSSRGSQGEGALSESIYLAFNQKLSTSTVFTYSISWNDKKAFWGKFREFGHMIKYRFFYDEAGIYHTIKSQPLKTPVWVPGTPFLAPTFDSQLSRVREVMIARGRIELPKILHGE
jgi:hypothetical protein